MDRRLTFFLAAALLAALAACSDPAKPDPEPGPVCTVHEDCSAKLYCADGACLPLEAGACRKVGDCNPLPGGGADCVDDHCHYFIPCRGAPECPAGQGCVSQVCVPLVYPACGKDEDCGSKEACWGGTCLSWCDLPENVALRTALQAAAPDVTVHPSSGKAVREFTKQFQGTHLGLSFPCDVSLRFKDLDGDGALTPYEDWTLSPALRAADLATRLGAAGRRALLAHPALADVHAAGATGLAPATAALLDAGVRSGSTTWWPSTTTNSGGALRSLAGWSNALQARCEGSPLGVPFLLSTEPAHTEGPGRTHANGLTYWPPEVAFGAGRDLARVETWGRLAAQEYRALGIRMVLQPSANLATDPRWPGAPWTFGEDSATASAMAAAFVKGAQGAALGRNGVAVVLGEWPGAGAAKGGFDARLAKGKYTSYPGGRFEEHARAFDGALAAGVAGVSTARAIPEAGPWNAFIGAVNGATLEQVGASFNATLVSGLLRDRLGFGGLVVAPAGVLEDAGLAPLGTPWGVEGLTRPARIAKAVGAGVDLFVGLGDLDALAAAGLDDARVTASAMRLLTLAFRLGLFEDPYVDATTPGTIGGPTHTAEMYQQSLYAMWGGMVLLRNVQKPAGFLNGGGNGTQTNDPFNAGNGTLKVLPAPPGTAYLLLSNFAYFAGDFDLEYVNSVSSGYTSMMNGARVCGWSSTPVTTDAERMACSDYVFVRVKAPWTLDPDAGALGLPTGSLSYAATDAEILAPVAAARAAIDAMPGSRAQLVVIVDAWRPSVVGELLSDTYKVSALYLDFSGALPGNPYGDKTALDVAFGILAGTGKLPFALPASDAAAAAQLPDVAGDGADPVFVRGYGLQTTAFSNR
ncbi:MAG: glycoside hydrolase family 3 N-terminal domain-containing protein [Anaeromyxobacteraceae bacterium]